MKKLVKIEVGESRGKRVLHTICDKKLNTLLIIFSDLTYIVMGISSLNKKFDREEFHKPLIDIFMPEERVAEVVERQEKVQSMWGYDAYWD